MKKEARLCKEKERKICEENEVEEEMKTGRNFVLFILQREQI